MSDRCGATSPRDGEATHPAPKCKIHLQLDDPQFVQADPCRLFSDCALDFQSASSSSRMLRTRKIDGGKVSWPFRLGKQQASDALTCRMTNESLEESACVRPDVIKRKRPTSPLGVDAFGGHHQHTDPGSPEPLYDPRLVMNQRRSSCNSKTSAASMPSTFNSRAMAGNTNEKESCSAAEASQQPRPKWITFKERHVRVDLVDAGLQDAGIGNVIPLLRRALKDLTSSQSGASVDGGAILLSLRLPGNQLHRESLEAVLGEASSSGAHVAKLDGRRNLFDAEVGQWLGDWCGVQRGGPPSQLLLAGNHLRDEGAFALLHVLGTLCEGRKGPPLWVELGRNGIRDVRTLLERLSADFPICIASDRKACRPSRCGRRCADGEAFPRLHLPDIFDQDDDDADEAAVGFMAGDSRTLSSASPEVPVTPLLQLPAEILAHSETAAAADKQLEPPLPEDVLSLVAGHEGRSSAASGGSRGPGGERRAEPRFPRLLRRATTTSSTQTSLPPQAPHQEHPEASPQDENPCGVEVPSPLLRFAELPSWRLRPPLVPTVKYRHIPLELPRQEGRWTGAPVAPPLPLVLPGLVVGGGCGVTVPWGREGAGHRLVHPRVAPSKTDVNGRNKKMSSLKRHAVRKAKVLIVNTKHCEHKSHHQKKRGAHDRRSSRKQGSNARRIRHVLRALARCV